MKEPKTLKQAVDEFNAAWAAFVHEVTEAIKIFFNIR